MTQSRNCCQCGKQLNIVVDSSELTRFEIKKEKTICGECALTLIGRIPQSMIVDPKILAFVENASKDLEKQTGLKPPYLSMICQENLEEDAEITLGDENYQVVLHNDLAFDNVRWDKARNYLISWIQHHPLQKKIWKTIQSTRSNLAQDDRYVFIFLPKDLPEPPNTWGLEVAKGLCGSVDPSKIGWTVFPVSTETQECINYDIKSVLREWIGEQPEPKSIGFTVRSLDFHFDFINCTCIIAQWLN